MRARHRLSYLTCSRPTLVSLCCTYFDDGWLCCLSSSITSDIFESTVHFRLVMPNLLTGECPTIARHPTNKHIAVGMPVVFECQATGAPPLMYAWMHNGIDLPAKNQRRLEFVVHQRSKGEYSCRVENEFGSSKSDPAMLTVGEYIIYFRR